MNKDYISVIIPTYKPGNYIYECLDSLCRQTLPKEQFEVIVVLNGEKEPFFSQIKDYAKKHINKVSILLLYSEKAGVSNARNMGIDKARGDYLTFVDDDDWVSDNYLAHLMEKADVSTIVASNVILTDEDTGKEMVYFLTDAYNRVAGLKHPSLFTARSFLSPPFCKLIPQAIISSDRFPTDFSLGEDSIFIFTISKRLKEIRFTDADTVYFVRYRSASASHRHYSYSFRVKLALRTSLRYVGLYLKSPFDYDFKFFLSRIAATLLKLFWKSYQ